ncbi:MAG: hypothetical protein JWO80_3050 [Bryobacterales bacterium]|nr:hypothetical protein [Bryobacterales bacterium]
MVTRTSRTGCLFISGILIVTAGCGSGMRAKAPAPPPAPQPAAPAPAPPQPLILAQTTVELPRPQPVPPESVPPPPPFDGKAAESGQPVIETRRGHGSAKGEPARGKAQEPPAQPAPSGQPAVPPGTQPAPGEPVPAPTLTEPAPELQSGVDLGRSNASIEARLRDLHAQLRPFANSQNAATKSAAGRIGSFLRLADQALKRGELRQAEAMADRAQTLLRELTR